MPPRPLPDHVLQETVDAVNRHGSLRAASRACAIPRATLQCRLDQAIVRGIKATQFTVKAPPSELLPVDELRRRRREQFEQLDKSKRAKQIIPVRVNMQGPIALSVFGDPHIDDDGTDIRKLERHVEIVQRTEGMFGCNIGDALNNWTGRLARLYSEQSTSAKEAWALGEWFVRAVPWLVFLGGNHGAWSGAGDPVRWMLDNCATLYDDFAVRIGLDFPSGRIIRINARHDFSGHSMWNTVHGALKAATMGWRDHLLICGHLHTSGYAVLKDPSSGLISHAVRVSSYKTWDRYAHEKGLPNQDIFCNATIIIDPRYDDDDPRLIHMCFDPEQGADYLTWLRSKANA